MKKKIRIKDSQIEIHKSLAGLNVSNKSTDWYKTGDMIEYNKSNKKFKNYWKE